MNAMDQTPPVTARQASSQDPEFAALMARIDLHLARAREHFARAAWIRKERERWEREQRRPRGIFIGRL
jgi:hypothetical protein